MTFTEFLKLVSILVFFVASALAAPPTSPTSQPPSLSIIEAKNYSKSGSKPFKYHFLEKASQRCLLPGYQAIILGAIDTSSLSHVLDQALESKVPVIDLINGYEHPAIKSHARVNFSEMASAIANHLRRHNTLQSGPLNILWIPGPKGPQWVSDGDAGIQKLMEQRKLNILDTLYIAPFVRTQKLVLEKWLSENIGSKLDYIIGTAPTAEAAMYLRNTLHERNIGIAAYYYHSKISDCLRDGEIIAASYDAPDVQARMSIDMAIKILEKRPYETDAGPLIDIITADNIDQVLPDKNGKEQNHCSQIPASS